MFLHHFSVVKSTLKFSFVLFHGCGWLMSNVVHFSEFKNHAGMNVIYFYRILPETLGKRVVQCTANELVNAQRVVTVQQQSST